MNAIRVAATLVRDELRTVLPFCYASSITQVIEQKVNGSRQLRAADAKHSDQIDSLSSVSNDQLSTYDVDIEGGLAGPTGPAAPPKAREVLERPLRRARCSWG